MGWEITTFVVAVVLAIVVGNMTMRLRLIEQKLDRLLEAQKRDD